MNYGILSSFTAGVLTIFTPCVLPMIPMYLAFLTGKGIQDMKEGMNRWEMLRLVLPFVIGFTLIFVMMGATASILGIYLEENRDMFRKVLGVFVILFALYFLKLLPSFNFMFKDTRFIHKIPKDGMLSSFMFGIAFAIGWSPCVGPILASVLALAAIKETMYQGMLLLAVYSMGFAIPLIIIALLINKILPLFKKINSFLPKFEVICGLILFEVGRYLIFG